MRFPAVSSVVGAQRDLPRRARRTTVDDRRPHPRPDRLERTPRVTGRPSISTVCVQTNADAADHRLLGRADVGIGPHALASALVSRIEREVVARPSVKAGVVTRRSRLAANTSAATTAEHAERSADERRANRHARRVPRPRSSAKPIAGRDRRRQSATRDMRRRSQRRASTTRPASVRIVADRREHAPTASDHS